MTLLRTFASALFLVPGFVMAQFTDVINSNRPGESMAAFSVGKTVIQAEAGLYMMNEKDEELDYDATGLGMDMNLRYGAFFEQLEFHLDLQYQRDNFKSAVLSENRGGFRQMILGAKYLIYDPDKNYVAKPDLYSWKKNHSFKWRELIPAVGVYAGLNMNLFDSPYFAPDDNAKVTPKVMAITQNQFGKWVLVMNFMLDRLGSKYENLGYIGTVTRGFNPQWSAFLEGQIYKDDFRTDGIIRGGAAYLFKENMQFDISIGKNLDNAPNIIYGGVGMSWRFDSNYEEVILRAPNEDDGKGKDKDKKGKDKKKKRKDEVELEETPAGP
jgi:hypothetical protein